MKRLSVLFVFLLFGIAISAQKGAAPVTLGSRVLADGSHSLLVDVQQFPGDADEVRIELPGNTAKSAVLLSAPADWTLAADGGSIRLAGPAKAAPMRFRVTLFDLKELKQTKVRIRRGGKNLLDKSVKPVALPPLQTTGSIAHLLEFPVVVMAGETIEATVLDPSKTPADGQWVIDGVVAKTIAPGRLSVHLPEDLEAGSPVRISYFDGWGERVVDALAAEETVVAVPNATGTPRITSCASYTFIGQSLCVCGDFPQTARNALRIDGQPATVIAASRHVVQVGLPSTVTPGPHTITGDVAVGFPSTDRALTVALRLQGTLDRNKLLKGQTTSLRLAIQGASQPLRLTITNKTPTVVSIPGGNYQEVATSGGNPNSVERRVHGIGRGDFEIDYKLEGPPCPCQQEARGNYPSTASRPAPLAVPRRVLATIAGGTPAVTLTTAQAIAIANGLSVVEVDPLPSINAGLVVFEIQDGLAAAAKVAALAADPRVTLAQQDFVYDTSQSGSSAAAPAYGLHMIGADRVQGITHGEGVRVGVIDAGIDTGNVALAKKVTDYSDVTKTGWTPDAHGTLVAGVIASDSSGGSGTGGVAPGVQLVAVKSCVAESPRLATARCWSSTLARGIDVALQKNVRVMNLSVGGPEDKLLAKLVDSAVRKGTIVVSAVGNDGPGGKPSYPAAFEGVIAITAVDAADRLYPQATRGSFVDLAAPGVDILSTGPGGRMQLFSGTSAATAFGTGAIALLIRERSNLTQPELNALLRDTAKDLGAAGPDTEFGYGLLDVCRAFAKLSNRKLACQ